MARTRSLTSLISDVRFRADNKAAQDSDITELINQSIADLRDMLIAAFGDEYFEVETTLTTTANANTVPLPADFYKLTGVWWVISGSQKIRLSKYAEVEAERFLPGTGWSYYGQTIAYRLQVGNLRLIPTPLSAYTLTLKYLPTTVRLAAGTDVFDGYNGWEEWVILDAAKKLLEREGNDSDAALLQARAARMEARIASLADRDQAEPARIQDVRGCVVGGWRWGRM